MRNYTGHGWEGSRYDQTLDIKEIAKKIRQYVKAKFPKCKFSVTIGRFSMGQELSIHLIEAPFEALTDPSETYHQVNHYQFHGEYEEGMNNGRMITKDAWDCLKDVSGVACSFNYDDSDGMIDYFDTNFYLHLNIGKWDKPFKRMVNND